jgi:hypothetical protein
MAHVAEPDGYKGARTCIYLSDVVVLAYPSANLALCGSLCAWVSGKLTKAIDGQSLRKSTDIPGPCVRDLSTAWPLKPVAVLKRVAKL